jgi:hypothetical protein
MRTLALINLRYNYHQRRSLPKEQCCKTWAVSKVRLLKVVTGNTKTYITPPKSLIPRPNSRYKEFNKIIEEERNALEV